jgi:hypothetical protein
MSGSVAAAVVSVVPSARAGASAGAGSVGARGVSSGGPGPGGPSRYSTDTEPGVAPWSTTRAVTGKGNEAIDGRSTDTIPVADPVATS